MIRVFIAALFLQGPSPEARLVSLYSAEWNWRLRELARLDSIPLDSLSAEGKVNAQVFRATISALATDITCRTYEAPFNSDTFFWTEFTPRQGFATAEAYRNYLGRLRDVPRYFDEQMANLRAGLARGYTVPRVPTVGRDKTIEPYLQADSTNPLSAAFTWMPAAISPSDQAALRAEARTVLRDVVAPAYGRLLTMMRTEYLPKTRTTIAAAALPDGDAFYQAMIERFTTLTLTARQIHDIGLAEVARIEAEMEATKQRAEFFKFLRNDPQFYAKTPRELLSHSAYISKKADGKLSQAIGFLPRYRHGILPVPDNLAPIYTGGRGGLESCPMNTCNLPARPLYTIPPLTLHECTPGHSFQAALALEGPERPPFRRGASFSGYTEGWGLLVARASDGVPAGAGSALGARDHHRGGTLHCLAGPGAGGGTASRAGTADGAVHQRWRHQPTPAVTRAPPLEPHDSRYVGVGHPSTTRVRRPEWPAMPCRDAFSGTSS